MRKHVFRLVELLRVVNVHHFSLLRDITIVSNFWKNKVAPQNFARVKLMRERSA
jgi:hypothetical protein